MVVGKAVEKGYGVGQTGGGSGGDDGGDRGGSGGRDRDGVSWRKMRIEETTWLGLRTEGVGTRVGLDWFGSATVIVGRDGLPVWKSAPMCIIG